MVLRKSILVIGSSQTITAQVLVAFFSYSPVDAPRLGDGLERKMFSLRYLKNLIFTFIVGGDDEVFADTHAMNISALVFFLEANNQPARYCRVHEFRQAFPQASCSIVVPTMEDMALVQEEFHPADFWLIPSLFDTSLSLCWSRITRPLLFAVREQEELEKKLESFRLVCSATSVALLQRETLFIVASSYQEETDLEKVISLAFKLKGCQSTFSSLFFNDCLVRDFTPYLWIVVQTTAGRTGQEGGTLLYNIDVLLRQLTGLLEL